MCLKTKLYLDRNIYSIPHSVTVTTHNTYTLRQTDTHLPTHTHAHTPRRNYNEHYNHYVVTASRSSIIGIQGRCWQLGGRRARGYSQTINTRSGLKKENRSVLRDLWETFSSSLGLTSPLR